MSTERYEQIIFRVYEKALMKYAFDWLPYTPPGGYLQTQEIFIHKCKIDKEFSEEFGLKIEERELDYNERCNLYVKKYGDFDVHPFQGKTIILNNFNIPTKLITIQYNGEKIEVHE